MFENYAKIHTLEKYRNASNPQIKDHLMTARSLTIQLIGLLLLCLALVYFIPILQKSIPNKINKMVSAHLHDEGLDWVTVQSKGRNIILYGNTLNPDEHQKALDLSQSFWFVKTVQDEISPKVISPYSMNIRWENQQLFIDGYIHNAKDKKILKGQLKSRSVQYRLNMGLGAPKYWGKLRSILLKQVVQLDSALIKMIDKSIYISGRAIKGEDIKQMEQALSFFKKEGYNIITHITSLDESAIFCQNKFDTLLKNTDIQFKTGNAIIAKKSDNLLKNIADSAVFCADYNIIITGYTDNVGDIQSNKDLSLQRAKSVKGRLFSQGGIALERLKTIGKGSDDPIDTNTTKEGRENNRRIELKIEGL